MNVDAEFWPGIENEPGFSAVGAVWERRLGPEHEIVRNAFLQPQPGLARAYPCPHDCGCEHEVIATASGWGGVCRCEAWNCPDLVLSEDDLRLWTLSLTKLGRAICGALQLRQRLSELGVPGAIQVGDWSTDSVPVLLVVADGAAGFRATVSELCARLRRRLIIFAPTDAYFDAGVAEIVERSQSAVFSLQETMALTPNGSLAARRSPGSIFSAFLPAAAAPLGEDTARSAFELVRRLDTSEKLKPPTLLTVFRLYCVEQLSATRIARLTNCAKSTVLERLKLLKRKTGVDPEQLRPLSLHLARVDEALTDPRAKRIYRRAAAFGDEEEPEG